MKNTAIMAGVAALLLSSSMAIAHPGGMSGLDADDDGNITRAELSANLDARFEKLDTNGDGQISDAELDAARDLRKSEKFARFDTDGDGSISKDEKKAVRALRDETRTKHDGDRRAAFRDMLDTNGDGVITKAELEASAVERFEKHDVDGDGTITEQERVEMRSKRQ